MCMYQYIGACRIIRVGTNNIVTVRSDRCRFRPQDHHIPTVPSFPATNIMIHI